MNRPDYFAMARLDARTAFQILPGGQMVPQAELDEYTRMAEARRLDPRVCSHWAYYDSTTYALCGEPIRAEQRTHTPSCPSCLAKLEQMRLEDQR